jgi:hypothetical protein
MTQKKYNYKSENKMCHDGQRSVNLKHADTEVFYTVELQC